MKLVQHDKDVYQIVDENGAVAFFALRLTNDRWGAYDRNDHRLTRTTFDAPKDVFTYVAGRAALATEGKE